MTTTDADRCAARQALLAASGDAPLVSAYLAGMMAERQRCAEIARKLGVAQERDGFDEGCNWAVAQVEARIRKGN